MARGQPDRPKAGRSFASRWRSVSQLMLDPSIASASRSTGSGCCCCCCWSCCSSGSPEASLSEPISWMSGVMRRTGSLGGVMLSARRCWPRVTRCFSGLFRASSSIWWKPADSVSGRAAGRAAGRAGRVMAASMLAATSAAVLAAGREPSGRGRAGVADPPYEKVCCVSMLGRYGLSASLEAPAEAEGVRRRVRLGGAILSRISCVL